MVLINGEADSFTDMHKASERVNESKRERERVLENSKVKQRERERMNRQSLKEIDR
jgi:hypothetical protein